MGLFAYWSTSRHLLGHCTQTVRTPDAFMNKCVRIIIFFLSRRELGMPVIAPADSVQLPWLTLVNGRVPGVRR